MWCSVKYHCMPKRQGSAIRAAKFSGHNVVSVNISEVQQTVIECDLDCNLTNKITLVY